MRRFAIPARMIMLGSFAWMSIVNYGFGLAMGWLLVPGDFGLLAFVQTLLTITGLILNSGFAWSLTAALVGAERSRRAVLVRGASGANLLLALVIGALIVLLFALGPLRSGLETWTITALVVGTLPLLASVAIARATMQGAERFGLLALIWAVETVAKAATGTGLVLAGLGVVGAIVGFFVGALVAAGLALVLLARTLEIRPWGAVERPALRAARDMFGALLGMALLLNLDLVALKLFAADDRALVGYYQAGIVLANMPYYLTTALIPVLFTQIARLRQAAQTEAVVGEALRLALVVILPLEIGLLIAPETILGLLFPAAYQASAATLSILALGNSALILVAILSAAFQATGAASVPARSLLAIVAVEIAALWMVVPIWQAVGAATCFLVAALGALLVLGGAYARVLGPRILQSVATWLTRYAAALAVGGIVTAIVAGLTHQIILALIVGGVGYLSSALGLGLASLPMMRASRRLNPSSVAKGN